MKTDKNINYIESKKTEKKKELNFFKKINNNHKPRQINHERYLTNYQMNRKNNKEELFLNELKDIKERENKMNLLKEEINNNKLINHFEIKSGRRKREYYFSEPNLDINEIIDKKTSISNKNQKNNLFNNEELIKASPIIADKNESNYLNDNLFTKISDIYNEQNIKNEENNEKEENRINNSKYEKKYGQIIKKKNNNDNIKKKCISEEINNKQNNTPEKDFKKIKNIIDELKVENMNLKIKNETLKSSLEKKDKIIETLNIKINELEKWKKNNNNKNQRGTFENIKKENNDLKLKNKLLLNQNQNLILGIKSFNKRIGEINLMIEKKNKRYFIEIYDYKNKLAEYKDKIVLLKRRVNELYDKDSFLKENENIVNSKNSCSYNKLRKNFIFHSYNFMNNNILETGYENSRRTDIFLKDKTHHRDYTLLNIKTNCLENI